MHVPKSTTYSVFLEFPHAFADYVFARKIIYVVIPNKFRETEEVGALHFSALFYLQKVKMSFQLLSIILIPVDNESFDFCFKKLFLRIYISLLRHSLRKSSKYVQFTYMHANHMHSKRVF